MSHQNGSHQRDGVFIAAGPDFAPSTVEEAHIWDVAPTLLHLFGQPVPEAMDGRVLEEALVDDRDVERITTGDAADTGGRLSEDDEAAMREQLSDLGYFE